MNARSAPETPSVVVSVTPELALDLELEIQAEERATAEKKQRLAAMLLLLPAGAVEAARRQRKVTSAPVFQSASKPVGGALPPSTPIHPALVFDESDVTMQGSVVRTLKGAGRGMTHVELRESLEGLEHLKKKWEGGYEQPFYKAVTNCVRRGVVKKHQGLLYARDVLAKLLEGGAPLPVNTSRALPRYGTGHAVQKLLEEQPNGLTGPEIRERLLASKQNLPPSFRDHPQYLYNILATMERRGNLIKRGEIYLSPKSEKG